MSVYLVMEPPGGDALIAGERARLLRDGFSFLAFLLPVPWLLFNRLWIEAIVAFAVTLAIAALGSVIGFGSAAPLLSLLVSVFVGMEARVIAAAALRRRGWRDWGVVEGRDAAEAELRYATARSLDADAEVAAPTAAVSPTGAVSHAQRPSGPALGLFAYPGSR